jgi:hypothetical protein
VEQNERHIKVLKELIDEQWLGPTRLGIRIPLSFINVVVVQPSCSIVGKYPSDASVYRVDALVKTIRAKDPSVLGILKIVSTDTLYAFARSLVGFHKPAPQVAAAEATVKKAQPVALPVLARAKSGV